MGKLADYIEKKWGVPTATKENPVTDTVGAGVTRILGNNPDRFEAVIINYDDAVMRVAPSRAVSETRGIPLEAAGGFVVLTADDEGEALGWEWFIWSEAGDGTIYILETYGR